MARLPGREVGMALCRRPTGEVVAGPVALGDAMSVRISLRCPADSTFYGLLHTHPRLPNGQGGIAKLSAQDIRDARRVGAEVACVATESNLNCFKIKR